MFGEVKFLVDFMLGRLARNLRLLGYDAKYLDNKHRQDITTVSLLEKRIVLTKHTKVSAKKCWKLLFVKSDSPKLQLQQVIKECGLKADKSKLFSLCTLCNERVIPIMRKDEVKESVPEYVLSNTGEFSTCPKCGHIYWKGTHYDLAIAHLKKDGIGI